jgi:thioesterase domain-containing protein
MEMAPRLIETGRSVASLTIVDSEVPDNTHPGAHEYNDIEAIMKWVGVFELALDRPLGVTRDDLESRSEAAQMKLLHQCLVTERCMPARSRPDVLRGPLRTFARSLRTHFRPAKSYPGPIRLVLADDPKLDEVDNRLQQEHVEEGWKRWAPNLVSTRTPGNHMTVLKPPHVDALARLMKKTAK